MSSEIFSAFGRKKLDPPPPHPTPPPPPATINVAIVVGNGTYPNLTLPFLPDMTSPYLTLP